MAISAGFKQVCPSCEALVPIKDASMIGKKVDCPKCKYRFLVENPSQRDKQAVKKDAPGKKETAVKGKGAPPAKSKANGKAKNKDDEVDDLDELEEIEEEVEDLDELEDDLDDLEETDDLDEDEEKPKKKQTAVKGKNGKAAAQTKLKEGKAAGEAKKKAAPKRRDEDEDEEAEGEEEEEDTQGKKKGKKADNKKRLGLGLAVVGLLVLAVAAFIILRGGKNKGPDPGPPLDNPNPPPPVAEGKKDSDPSKPLEKNASPVVEALSPSGPWLTNLLPNDTEHVVHVFFKEMFEDVSNPMRKVAFETRGAFEDSLLQKQLGFSVLAIDDLIRAEKYTGPPWSFTVVHFSKYVNEKALVEALSLKPAKPINKQTYYRAEPDSLIEQFSRMSFGVPSHLRALSSRREVRPLFVRLHNPQTVIFADEAPLLEFLKKEGQFKYLTEKPAPPPVATDPNQPAPPPDQKPPAENPPAAQPPEGQPAGQPQPGQPADPNQPPMPPPAARDSYMTIKPTLKAMLERMESKQADSKDRVLLSFATEMDAALLDTSRSAEYRDTKLWHPRQVWDSTLLLKEKTNRIRWLAAGLHQKEMRVFHYKNEMSCRSENEAKALHKDLLAACPEVAKAFELLLAHKVDYPKPEAPSSPDQPPPPQDPSQPPASEAQVSKMAVNQAANSVHFTVDLVLDQVAYGRIYTLAELALCSLRGEIDLATHQARRHQLARAGKVLGEQGLAERSVPPGTYPPGALKRPPSSLRTAGYPQQRISWMAGLLPYLGQETIYRKIDFDSSWRDPLNWVPARTLVPEFLDPTYPHRARLVAYADLGEVAATHFVGIAGVGLDAADYDPNDPANAHKLGVLGYEKSRSLEVIQQNRGLANTILLLQVPHDGPVGVTPWMAGGGSTLRGVPEKNSVAPFVLTTDRDGKPITHNGKRGTYALMTDGSVRFIDQSVSDEVFKAMCTVKGPAPADLEKNEWAPLLESPRVEGKLTSKEDPKSKTEPAKKGP
jgi:hypothetical protein